MEHAIQDSHVAVRGDHRCLVTPDNHTANEITLFAQRLQRQRQAGDVAELARRAKVGLATIQRLERSPAGRLWRMSRLS